MNILELKYVPLEQLSYWADNAKLHDIGSIIESMQRYGFKDPLKYEPLLNEGQGGIVEGNGRLEALLAMQSHNMAAPNGILIAREQTLVEVDCDYSEWLVPVLFGVDAESELEAKAYGLDHNNIAMLGGDFTALDISGQYDRTKYLAILSDISTVSVDEDDTDLIRKVENGDAWWEDELRNGDSSKQEMKKDAIKIIVNNPLIVNELIRSIAEIIERNQWDAHVIPS